MGKLATLEDGATRASVMSTLGAPSILWKAFDVLGAFRADRRVLTFAEVSRASGLPKSTTHRVLAMLLEMGAVERQGHGYRIGLRIFAMGSCSAEVALRDLALPVLQEIHRLTRQTVHLAVLRGGDVVYIEKLRTRVALPTPAVVGERLPAHCTAIGKSLLPTRAVADPVRAPLPARTRGRAGASSTRPPSSGSSPTADRAGSPSIGRSAWTGSPVWPYRSAPTARWSLPCRWRSRPRPGTGRR